MKKFFNNIPAGFWRFSIYVLLYAIIKVFIERGEHPWYVSLILSSFFIVPEFIIDYYPRFLAFVFIRKTVVIATIVAFCSLLFGIGFFLYDYKSETYLKTTFPVLANTALAFILQGLLLGFISRMLLIHYFYQLIKAKEVFTTKLLILLVYFILLIVFPFHHKFFAPFYSLGYGIGFTIHYLIRSREKKHAQYTRLAKNLLFHIEAMKSKEIANKEKYRLSSEHEKAIELYAKRKWELLTDLLSKVAEDEIFFFIDLSMKRKRHDYHGAIGMLNEKAKFPPEWFITHKNFYFLHLSLNRYETLTPTSTDAEKKAIIDNLDTAIELNENCLLSITTLALVLANETVLSDTITQENENRRKRASDLIWKAMKIYENREEHPKIISLALGMTIPFTHTFLLDTYGYVLYKNHFFKFAKVIFNQCIAQDPSFSASYLHLAELYIHSIKKPGRKNNEYHKSAKLNLYIAIQSEKLKENKNVQSFITKKAYALLGHLDGT